MTFLLEFGVIDEGGAAVPQRPVIDKLHLPWFEVEIDRQRVVLENLEHRRDGSRPGRVDRLALQRVAAVDLMDAEPRLDLGAAGEHRGGKDRAFAGMEFALAVEPERLVKPWQLLRAACQQRIVRCMK